MSRSDAARNRVALLRAAEKVFRTHGAYAPLDLVVQQAGLGRATLYRHFGDREALVQALFGARVEALEDLRDQTPGGDLLEVVLREVWEMQRDLPGLFSVLSASQPGRAELRLLGHRTEDVLAEGVDRARDAGWLHPEVTTATVLGLLRMLPGAAQVIGDGAAVAPGDDVLEVVLRGLRRSTP